MTKHVQSSSDSGDRPALEMTEAALIEASCFLAAAIGESVPLADYRDSVEVLFSALKRGD